MERALHRGNRTVLLSGFWGFVQQPSRATALVRHFNADLVKAYQNHLVEKGACSLDCGFRSMVNAQIGPT